MNVKVISIFEKENDPNGIYINTTSKSKNDWQRDLSPFYLGPCELYDGLMSQNVENAWQYSKVYLEFCWSNGDINQDKYFEWAKDGWDNSYAVRYPMGKGKKPLYSLWNGEKLNYIQARKQIYVPLYAKSVTKTEGYERLKLIYNLGIWDYGKIDTIYLKDYDAYRHEDLNMSLTDVLNYPNKKMGHAFVLMMLLTKDEALKECDI